MKKLLLLSFSLLFFSANLSAQTCGTPDLTPSERAYFLNTIKNYIVVKNSGTTCIPIKPYVFREDNGSGGVSLESLSKGLANLNHKYLEAGIEFYYSAAPVYIDSSDLNNFDEQAPDNDTEAMLINAAGEVTDAVNIYFVNSITTSSGFNAAGYAYFPSASTSSNRILMIHNATSGNSNGTFTHEFGHYFALPHTHSGTEFGPSNSNAENVPRTGANANCSTHGDSFCDTDADPRYSNTSFNTASCTYTGSGTDINSVAYNPLTAITNIMSYYPDACVTGFSPEQYTAITQGLIARQGFTNYNYTAPPMTVTTPSGLTATLSGGVTLNWTDNASNEMGYIIERSSTSSTSGFQALEEGGTGENVTTFSDLTASSTNTTYYYRVKASNGNCNTYSNVDSITITYCLAGSANCDEILTNVTVGSINNSSTVADCATSTYQDYTASSTSMTTGTSYPISFTASPSYLGDSISVWIDWNQDNDFEDAGESILTINASTGSASSSITPPLSALAGNTRMRVRLFYGSNNEDCGIVQYGEVEDYTINVVSTSPSFSISNGNMSGFTYLAGNGPSTSQTNSITWANLVDSVSSLNIVNNFEFSTDGGISYHPASTALNIAIPPFPNTFGPQSIEIRLISGLAVGTYLDTIYLSTADGMSGTISDTVYLSGTVTQAPCSQLFISEYGEPSSGNGKYIEIYNPTATTVDLSNYRIWKISNGGSWPESTFNLSGSLVSGGVWVVGNNATDVASSNQVSTGTINFNGDDAIGIAYNGGSGSVYELIDAIGTDGPDPGSGWDVAGTSDATANRTLKRKTSIQVPNTDWTASAGTSIADSEWEVISYSQADLGSHTTACVAVCSIDALAANTQTACLPASNTYTQEITVTYSTAPASGTLDINGQSFTISSSPQTVTLTGLTADGAAVNVSASFSADATCSLDSTALFTAPANCSPTCNISGITAGTQTACVPATNTYTQEVTVTYAVPPASGTLDINGQSFAITSSPQTETLTGLTADGIAVNVTAVFSADAACTFTANSLFTAAADCTPTTPCSELMISEYVEGSSNNKYIEIYNPTAATVDLTNYELVLYANGSATTTGTIDITGSILSGDIYVVRNSSAVVWTGTSDFSSGSLNFNGNDVVALRNNGINVDVFGTIGSSSTFASNTTRTRMTNIQVPTTTYDPAEWTSSASNTVSDLGSHTTACVAVCSIDALAANTQTACLPASNTYTQEITVTYSTAPASGTLDINGQSFTISSSPQTVTLTGLTADGAAVNVSASFSADATCSLDSTALFTAPANCSPTCNISGITAGTQTACVPATNTYTQEVTVTYAVPPASGTLDINGQSFAITSSPQTETLTGLTADGIAVNVTAVFSADAACTFTANSLFTAAADCTPTTPCSELMISEYVEGSSNNKYIEIYNPTAATVDLTNYELVLYANGSATTTGTIDITGSILSGDIYVVRNSSAVVWTGTSDFSSGSLNFNGNDVVALRNNGINVDVFGTIGSSSTFASNTTRTRMTNIQVPTTTYDPAEWTSSASNTVSDLGSHITPCVTLTFDWLGTTDTDWNTATNWSSGIVPSSTDSVHIPDVSSASGNFPLITPSITLGNTTIDAGASLTVATGIVIDGTFTNNGIVTLQDGAYLDDFTHTGASFVGNIIVETTAANGIANDQRFISSPINNPNVSEIGDDLIGPWGTGLPGANGIAVSVDDCALQTLTAASNYGNLFELNETIMSTCNVDGWIVRSSGSLENARGYSAYLANGSTFDFEGSPNTGNISIATTNSGHAVVGGEGWNLIGNPYPSPISRDDVITAGATDAQYFVTTGLYQGSFSPYLPSSNIAIAQGFQVHVAANTNIAFDNSFRNTNAATWYSNNNWFTHKLEISVLGASSADKTILFYNNDATSSYEPIYDVSKRMSKLGQPSISTVGASKELSLNGMSVNDLGNVVPMNLYPGSNGNFELMFEGMGTFSNNTTIYVKDKLLNTVHNIANGNYSFSSNTDDVAERFEIIFVPEIEFITENINCDGKGGFIELLSTIGIHNRTFNINSNNMNVASDDLINLSKHLSAGDYTLDVVDQYGGTQFYNFNILEAEKIEAEFSVSSYEVEVGETINFNNLTANATNISWAIDNNNLLSINNLTYSFEYAGDYEIVMEVSNSDCSDTKFETVSILNKTIGIGAIQKGKIEIYPNPVSDVLTIKYQDDIVVELYSVLGENILRTEKKNISVKDLAPGIYIVQILNNMNEVISVNKLIKE